MTEIELLNRIRDVSTSTILASPHDYMIAQSTKDSIRINTGVQIVSLSKDIINFSGRYAIISKSEIEESLKVINNLARLAAIHFITLIPKDYGYKALVYSECKLKYKFKIKLIWSRSSIICYLALLHKIITRK